jgi:hypothetical protein
MKDRDHLPGSDLDPRLLGARDLRDLTCWGIQWVFWRLLGKSLGFLSFWAKRLPLADQEAVAGEVSGECWPELTRSLVPFEVLLEQLHRENVSYHIVTVSQVRGALDRERLAQALERLQAYHPRLGCVIGPRSRFPGDRGLRFYRRNPGPVPLQVVPGGAADWRSWVTVELNTPMASDRDLLRVVLLQGSSPGESPLEALKTQISGDSATELTTDLAINSATDLSLDPATPTHYIITTLNHAASDGLSSLQLHGKILEFCQNPPSDFRPNSSPNSDLNSAPISAPSSSPNSSESSVANPFRNSSKISCPSPSPNSCKTPSLNSSENYTTYPNFSPPLPPFTRLIPPAYQNPWIWISNWKFLVLLLLKNWRLRTQALPFEQTVPIKHRSCIFVDCSLDRVFTGQLRDRCRQESTTVHGAICAALLSAIAQEIAQKTTQEITPKNPRPISLVCRSYADLRRHLVPPLADEPLGLIVSSCATFHQVPAELQDFRDFWDLARDVKQQFAQGQQQGNLFRMGLMEHFLCYQLRQQPDRAPASLEVTNGGVVNLKETYGDLRLESIHFLPAQRLFGGLITVSVSTFKGVMTFTMVGSAPALSQATFDRVADGAVSYLRGAIEGHDGSKDPVSPVAQTSRRPTTGATTGGLPLPKSVNLPK